jgi:cleavage and polyadenylation specificity factor subunit 1
MDVYDQIIDPTRVSHSLACNFVSTEYKTLVVVKNTLLQLFKVGQGDKLAIISEYKLNCSIDGIKSIRFKNQKLDQLIILTKFAKLSLVSWDADNHSIMTNSLHFYELEFLKQSINAKDEYNEARLKLEPNGYCSLVIYNDLLAFLPFKQLDVGDEDEDVDVYEVENGQSDETVYDDSIVVPVTKLEASISAIIECEFLHNYKDPTLGILYNKSYTWAADLSIRKDTTNFILLSLDLTTGASTPILNVENLPYDVYQVKPLQSPLNGVLLIGANEILHVDNSGNVKGVGLNPYWSQCTDLKLNDQSELNLFLEDSQVEIMNDGNVLIVDQLGKFYQVEFKLDGKIIKDLSIFAINELDVLSINSQSLTIWDDYIFIGNGSSNSTLLKKFITEGGDITENIKESTKVNDDDEDEDLYDDDDVQDNKATKRDILKYKQTDYLINNGPISSFTLGKLSSDQSIQGLSNPTVNDVSIVCSTGEGTNGALTSFKPSIAPHIKSTLKFNNINKTWNLMNKYLITTDLSNYKSEIFLINENFRNFQTLDFKNNNITVNIDLLFSEERILQVTLTNIYLFDANFKKLFQINVDFEILSAKIVDPYVLITSSKGEIKIFEIDSKRGKKLNKVKLPNGLSDVILTSGNISNSNILNQDAKGLVFLVTTINNQLLIFERNHNEKFHQISHIHKLNEVVELEDFNNPSGLIPDPFIKEIELLEIGDDLNKEEYLFILTIGGELIFYKRFQVNQATKFVKVPNNLITGAPENIYSSSTILERKLIPIKFKDQQLIFVTGAQPYFIIKVAKSQPKIFKFTSNNAISITKIYNNDEFMYIDNQKNARICQLNFDESRFDYTQNLPIEKFTFGETVNNISFHETSQLFIISTLTKIPFDARDEDGVHIVGTQEDKPKSNSFKSSIKLVNPKGWTVIDEIEFPDNEVVNDLKTMNLTVSSRSKKKKEFVVIAIGKYRLEDLTVYGEYNIQDIISIVPDPNKPDILFKFKEISKEHVRGAATSVNEISGRFLTAQGQKVLIRDLQQDNSTVPVAFYDTATFISESKSFGNLLLLGDTLKSIWFLGFDAEPYRLLLLGKDLQDVNVSCADFIIFNDEIYFLVADDDENLQLLSYDPEDVKSLTGQKLLKKSSFKNNSLTTALKMIPSNSNSNNFQNLGVNVDGSIFKVLPISEDSYRRLYVLQQQISDKVAHYCGLNPKSNRYADNEVGYKPILEFNLLKYWFNFLNLDKRLNFSSKVGKNANLELWKDFIEIETSLDNLQSI